MNKPRSYSTLVDGKIVWVDPGDNPPVPARRSRLETDEEIKKRLKAAGHTPFGMAVAAGSTLDAWLTLYGLEPRRVVDVVA